MKCPIMKFTFWNVPTPGNICHNQRNNIGYLRTGWFAKKFSGVNIVPNPIPMGSPENGCFGTNNEIWSKHMKLLGQKLEPCEEKTSGIWRKRIGFWDVKWNYWDKKWIY